MQQSKKTCFDEKNTKEKKVPLKNIYDIYIYTISVHFNEDDDAKVTSSLNKKHNKEKYGLKKQQNTTRD